MMHSYGLAHVKTTYRRQCLNVRTLFSCVVGSITERTFNWVA